MASGPGAQPERRRFFPARFGLDEAEELETHGPSLAPPPARDQRPSSWGVPEQENLRGPRPLDPDACHQSWPQEQYGHVQASAVEPTVPTWRGDPEGPRPCQAGTEQPSPDSKQQGLAGPFSDWFSPGDARLGGHQPAALQDSGLWGALDEPPGAVKQGFGEPLDSDFLTGASLANGSMLHTRFLAKPGALSWADGLKSRERFVMLEAANSGGALDGILGVDAMGGTGAGAKRRAVLPECVEASGSAIGSLPMIGSQAPTTSWSVKLEAENVGPTPGPHVLGAGQQGLEGEAPPLQFQDGRLAGMSWSELEASLRYSERDTWLYSTLRETSVEASRFTTTPIHHSDPNIPFHHGGFQSAACQPGSGKGQSAEEGASLAPASEGAAAKSRGGATVPVLSGPSSALVWSADVADRSPSGVGKLGTPSSTSMGQPEAAALGAVGSGSHHGLSAAASRGHHDFPAAASGGHNGPSAVAPRGHDDSTAAGSGNNTGPSAAAARGHDGYSAAASSGHIRFSFDQRDESSMGALESSQKTAETMLRFLEHTTGCADGLRAGIPATAHPDQALAGPAESPGIAGIAGQSLAPTLDGEVEGFLSRLAPGPYEAGSRQWQAEEPQCSTGVAEVGPGTTGEQAQGEHRGHPAPRTDQGLSVPNGIHAPGSSQEGQERRLSGVPPLPPAESLSARLARAIDDLHGKGDAMGQPAGQRGRGTLALARYGHREWAQKGGPLPDQAGASLASAQWVREVRGSFSSAKSEPATDAPFFGTVLDPSERTAGGAAGDSGPSSGDGRIAAGASTAQDGSPAQEAVLGKRKVSGSSTNGSGGSSSSGDTDSKAGTLKLVPWRQQSPKSVADVALQQRDREHVAGQGVLESISASSRGSSLALKMIVQRAPTPPGHEMAGAVNAMKQRLMAAALSLEQGNVRQFQQTYSYLKTFAKPRGNALERLVFGSLQAFVHKMDGTAFEFLTTPCKKPIKDMIDARMWYFRTIPYGAFMSVSVMESILPRLMGHKFVHVVDFGDTMVPHWPKLMQVLRQHRQPGDRLEGIKITHVMTMPLGHPGRLDMTATSMAPPFAAALQSAAHELGVDFEFQSLQIDLEHLSLLDCIQRQPLEKLVFCAAFDMKFFSQDPAVGGGALQRLMSTLKRLKPDVAVLVEDEADSTVLPMVDRFAKMYDYMWTLYHAHDMLAPGKRKKSVHLCEQQYFNLNLCSVVACQGEERRIQLRSWEDWKRIFELYGFTTQPVSLGLRKAAEGILDRFTEGFGIFEGDGGLCLTWQGSPLLSTCSWTWGGG